MDTMAAPEPEIVNDQHDAFVFVGIKPAGLLRLLDLHSEIEQKSLITTDVCHTILKPMTVPEGWTDNVIVTDAEKGWYEHTKYHHMDQPERATWDEGDCCFIYKKKFTFFFRRHHCRACGHSRLCAVNTLNTERHAK
jgi:hypothetical protein